MNVRRTSGGFTLIEMTVIIAVLLILSSAIVPRLLSFSQSQRERAFMQQLLAMTAEGREAAIRLGKDVTMQYDDSKNAFAMHYQDDSQNDSTLQTVVLPPNFQASKFEVGPNTTGASDFKLTFYPDGTADGGGVEIGRNTTDITSISVDKATGTVSLLHDPLPEVSDQTWQAGDYVHRSG
jgi:type II secretory pathway pseudopilin PulG